MSVEKFYEAAANETMRGAQEYFSRIHVLLTPYRVGVPDPVLDAAAAEMKRRIRLDFQRMVDQALLVQAFFTTAPAAKAMSEKLRRIGWEAARFSWKNHLLKQ